MKYSRPEITGSRPPSPPLPAVTSKFKCDDRIIVTGVDFGVIWTAVFDYAIRFHVRRPALRLRVLWRAEGDPLTAGGAADLKSKSIIEISDPYNPKIDTNNDISLLNFTVTAGGE